MIDLATRRVIIAGITTNPNEARMLQMARHLTDAETGMLHGTQHLIVDRQLLTWRGVRPVHVASIASSVGL